MLSHSQKTQMEISTRKQEMAAKVLVTETQRIHQNASEE